MLSRVEHEKSYITSGPGVCFSVYVLIYFHYGAIGLAVICTRIVALTGHAPNTEKEERPPQSHMTDQPIEPQGRDAEHRHTHSKKTKLK